MRGVVLLDGPDAVGKTTLAYALLNGDTAGYIHLEYFPDDILWRKQCCALLNAAYRMSLGKLTVIDRHWPSELIYSRAYRDGTHMNGESRGWDRVMQRLCGVYVICAPEPESAFARHEKANSERTEMYESDERILDVAHRYHDLWYGNPFADPRIDYIKQLCANGGMQKREDSMLYDIDKDGGDLPLFANKVYRRLKYLQDMQYPPALNYYQPNFLGHAGFADVLFVGDKINPNKSTRFWPFIDFGASSAHISKVLHELEFNERRGCWVNANAPDQHIRPLLTYQSNFKTIIAFGNEAERHLLSLGIPKFYKVIHPSYAKRFGKTVELKAALKEIL